MFYLILPPCSHLTSIFDSVMHPFSSPPPSRLPWLVKEEVRAEQSSTVAPHKVCHKLKFISLSSSKRSLSLTTNYEFPAVIIRQTGAFSIFLFLIYIRNYTQLHCVLLNIYLIILILFPLLVLQH